MILVIDSGNSRIKLGVWDIQGGTGQALGVTTVAKEDLDGAQRWLSAFSEPISKVWGVNVAGASQQQNIERMMAARGLVVQWAHAQVRTGWLRNGYQQPSQLGADRWASMVGVIARYRSPGVPFVLASFGTATTIDIVDQEGLFRGGVILPGPALMRHSLCSGTANLPLTTSSATSFATDTHTAIASGIAAAQAGAFVRQCLLARQACSRHPAMYVSGGGWTDVESETRRLVADLLPDHDAVCNPIEFLNNPVLDGLVFMARQSQTEDPQP